MAVADEEKRSGGKEAAAGQVRSPADTDLTAGTRRLPVWAFIVIAAVYLVIVQGVSRLLTAGQHFTYAAPTSVNELWRSITVPVLVSLVFVYAVVGVLGWWRPVFADDRPVRRWVRVIPVIIAVTALAGMNYPGLGKHSAGFIVLLALSMLGVGFAEEGMFRGLGVVTFRASGFTWDLAHTPTSSIRVQACGDAHLLNFGMFAARHEGKHERIPDGSAPARLLRQALRLGAGPRARPDRAGSHDRWLPGREQALRPRHRRLRDRLRRPERARLPAAAQGHLRRTHTGDRRAVAARRRRGGTDAGRIVAGNKQAERVAEYRFRPSRRAG